MARTKRYHDQFELFDSPSFNILADLSESMRQSADKSGLSREQIVDRMNALAGRFGLNLGSGSAKGLTVDVLHKWLSGDPSRAMPLRALPIFCAATEDHEPLSVLARPLGCLVIDEQGRRKLQWAEAMLEEKQARKRKNALERDL